MSIPKKLLTIGIVVGVLTTIIAFLPEGIQGKFLGSSATISRNYVATDKFVTTWKTDNPGKSLPTQITIPTNPFINPNTGAKFVYDYTVDWGDGTTDTGVTGDKIHTYATAGTYTVTISGTFPSFQFNQFNSWADRKTYSDSMKLLTVEEWGTNIWQSFEKAFQSCENLIINATDTPNLTAVKSMAYMFTEAKKFDQPIGHWNVSNVVDMEGMFQNAALFNQDLTGWERGASGNVSTVGNVTNMKRMFWGAFAFNGDVSNWNVGKVTDMGHMFFYAIKFNQDLNSWNVGKVTNMERMFEGAKVFNSDLSGWERTTPGNVSTVGNVTNMGSMFNQALKFNGNIGTWNVSKVTKMDSMFQNGNSFNQDISSWNVSNVTSMNSMFSNATVFNQDLSGWERTTPTVSTVSNVTDMGAMFSYATAFNQPLSSWNVSNVTSMSNMFSNAVLFNKPLNAWGEKTSQVTSMSRMFLSAKAFNQPLNLWNVSKVENMNNMFAYAEAFNGDVTTWNVSRSKDMSGMFAGTKVFNQDLSNWERTTSGNVSTVGNVTIMGCMFCGASIFNSDIGNWNVSKVTDMSNMFSNAVLFNKPLNAWGEKTSNVITMGNMFEGAKAFDQPLNSWNVSKVKSMNHMFNRADSFNGNISNWNTSQVTIMSVMFAGASSFNQDISKWDVANVVDMAYMFDGANKFNQDISSWNISKVVNMLRMFYSNASFSMTNYHRLLELWSSRPVKPNVTLTMSSKYCGVTVSAGRDKLTMPPNNWIIQDGGLDTTQCPMVPTNLRAIIKDNGRVDLTWEASVAPGSPAITDYLIQYKTAAGTWTIYDDGVSTSKTTTVSMVFTENIGYNFRVAAKNINVTGGYSTASNTIIIDTLAPVVADTFSLPELHNALIVPVTGFTATDAVGVTGYMITTTNTAPIATTSGWLPTAPSTHTFPAGTADGAKTLYAWAKDAVGNVSQSRNDNVMLDTTAPAINTFTIPAYSTSRSISVSVLTIDDIAAKFIITESATPPTTSAAWASVPAMPFIYETPSDGIKILYAWAKDTAGNISLSHSQHITVDTTAPVVTTLSLPVASNTLTDIPLTITATDAVGVTGYSIATTIAPPTTASAWTPTAPTTHTFPAGTIDGAYTLYAWAKDAAGQISAAKSVTILIDRVVPTMTAFIVPTTSASRDVAITTFTPSETLARTRYIITESNTPPLVTASGWSETIPATYPAPTDGSKILYAWVKDAAGNISPVFTGQSIIVDATAPVITTFAVPTRVNTLNLPNITLTATDVVGVTGYMITTSSTVPILTSANWLATAPNSYTFPAGTIEGAYTLYAWAKDAAGYISPASRKDIEIDMTKPTTPLIPTILPQTGVFEVSTTAIETNVSSLSVKVTCTPGDLPKVHYGLGLTVSSTEVCPASKNVTLSIPLGNVATYYTLYTTATDKAGNISDPSPTISIFKNPSATNSAPGAPDLHALYDSGVSNTDNITKEVNPLFTVTCTSGFIVYLYEDKTLLGTAPCMANTASIKSLQGFSLGSHALITIQKSPTGVYSLASAPLSVTIDTELLSLVFQKHETGSEKVIKNDIGFILHLNVPIADNTLTCGSTIVTNGICKSVTSLSKNKYSINVSATSPGVVSVSIPAGTIQTIAGNTNTQSTGVGSITYTPTVTISAQCGSFVTFVTEKPSASSLNGKALCAKGTPGKVSYNSSNLKWIYQCRGTDEALVSCTVSALLNSAPTCEAQELPFNKCSLKNTSNLYYFYEYLNCLGVAEKSSCNKSNGCPQEAKRQELVYIADQLRGIPLDADAYECQNKHVDTERGAASWVCEAAEKAQIAGLISATNTKFRPTETMTRAEAYSVLMKSICVHPDTDYKNWQTKVAQEAKELGFTIRSVSTFEPNKLILKQELYALAARIAEYKAENPDTCDDLPDDLICGK